MMNLNFIEIPNQAILASAKKYLLSAELLESQHAQLELGSILCASFSIELLLKSLLSKSSPQNVEQLDKNCWFYTGVTHRTAHGHSYLTLFNKLPSEHRSYLSGFFGSGNEFNSLESDLESFDDIFIKWRYSHELTNKSFNVTKLLLLNKKLYEAISHMEVVRKLS